nr:hypothetical protein [Clostridioides sp.]
MSITSLLNGKTTKDLKFKEIVNSILPDESKFKTLSGKKAFSEELTLKVPNKLTNPFDSAIVGIAFDYLARFRVAQKVKSHTNFEFVKANNFFWILLAENETHDKFKSRFNQGQDYVSKFVKSDNPIDKELIHHAYYWARLEQYWRNRKISTHISSLLDPPSIEIENELFNLMKEFEKSFVSKVVKEDSDVLFNPEFGKCTIVTKGADADIHIDGVLYDFKTTKYNSYKKIDIQQIISYYLLYKINLRFYDDISDFFTEDKEIKPINKVAVYQARYGEINILDMKFENSELIEKAVDELLILFKKPFMSKYAKLAEYGYHEIINEYYKDESISLYKYIVDEYKLYYNNVIVTPNSKTYHTDINCFTLSRSYDYELITKEEAKERGILNKCKLCK